MPPKRTQPLRVPFAVSITRRDGTTSHMQQSYPAHAPLWAVLESIKEQTTDVLSVSAYRIVGRIPTQKRDTQ